MGVYRGMRVAIGRKWVLALGSGLLSCCLALPVHALTLYEAYQSALQNDPFFRSGTFAARAGAEESNLGLSNLLPEISLSARRMDNRARRDIFFNNQVTQDQPVYQSLGAGVYLRQPLFDPEKYAAYKQGGLKAAEADSQLVKDRQDAILRVVGVYLEAVSAGQGARLADAQKQVAAARAQQAGKYVSAGEGTAVEAEDARSRLELATIRENEAMDKQLFSLSQLSQLTARDVGVLPELTLDPGLFDESDEPVMPLDKWLELAMANNPDIELKRRDLESAENATRKYLLAGNLPTVDLLANITRNNQDNVTALNQDIQNRAIGIEINLPLFKGGYYGALVRQSRAREEQARQDIEGAKLRTRLEVERQYRSVVSGRIKLGALLRVIKVGERMVVSAQRAFKAGINTSVDILNAGKDLQQSRMDFGDALGEYVLARLKLESLCGTLGDNNIKWAGQYFMAGASN